MLKRTSLIDHRKARNKIVTATLIFQYEFGRKVEKDEKCTEPLSPTIGLLEHKS